MEDDFFSILQKSVNEISLSPVLLMAGLLLGVLSLPVLIGYSQVDTTIQTLASGYVSILLPLLIMPFITGGALGYALEIREKKSSGLATFIESGKKHYMKLLMAGIVAFLVYNFLVTVAVVVLYLAMADMVICGLLGFATLLLVFLCLMVIEFYDIAIVADDVTVMQAFSNSIEFARRNWIYAIGFFTLIVLAKILVMMPLLFQTIAEFFANPAFMNMTSMNATLNATLNATMNSTLAMPQVAFSAPSLIMVAILQVILQGFVLAFVTLYKTEFFLTVRSRKRITDFDYDFSEEKKP